MNKISQLDKLDALMSFLEDKQNWSWGVGGKDQKEADRIMSEVTEALEEATRVLGEEPEDIYHEYQLYNAE